MSQRLINLVPPYYKKSKIANGIFGAVEGESDQLVDFALDVIKQGNPILATWGLSEWENQLKLPPLPEGTPIETRRARVLARHNIPPLITPAEMEKIAGEFTRTKRATVVEYGREKRFEVVVEIDDLLDYERLVETVYEMRPKHLSFSVLARTKPESIIVSASARSFEVEYPICGLFYAEDDLEGRIFREAVNVSESARTHTVDYPLTNTFYAVQE
jgi:Uncharacterised protein conserved in bacteria (DUF2313)